MTGSLMSFILKFLCSISHIALSPSLVYILFFSYPFFLCVCTVTLNCCMLSELNGPQSPASVCLYMGLAVLSVGINHTSANLCSKDSLHQINKFNLILGWYVYFDTMESYTNYLLVYFFLLLSDIITLA